MKTPPPLMMTESEFTHTMRRLRANKDFQVLQSFWLTLRIAICEAGKKTRDPHQWSKLDGFDAAIQAPDVWAAKSTDAARRKKERKPGPMDALEE